MAYKTTITVNVKIHAKITNKKKKNHLHDCDMNL